MAATAEDARPILVTGGAGFIGSHCVELLLARGHSVVVLDDLSAGKRSNLPGSEKLLLVHAATEDADAVDAAASDCGAVLHLAAQVSVQGSIEAPVRSAQANVRGYLNVLDAARRKGVARFVYASSAAVYGNPAELPLNEASPTRPISPYGLEKSINEQYAALYTGLYGLQCLGLRFFNVYGPRQNPASSYAGVISKFVARAVSGQAPQVRGSGEQTRDFVFVADVARACVAALFSKHTGVLCVGTGQSTSVLQLAQVVSGLVGLAAPTQHVASVAGDIEHSSMRPAALIDALGVADFTPLEVGLRALIEHHHAPAAL